MRKVSSEPKKPFEVHFYNILTVVLCVIVALQVFTRYVLNRSLSWTEEFSRYVFIWSTYFSVSISAYYGRHIRVSAHISLLPRILQKIILTLSDMIWLCFNIVVIFYSIRFNLSMFEYPLLSETTGFNLVWIYMIIPIGFTMLTVRVFVNMIKRIRKDVTISDQRMNV